MDLFPAFVVQWRTKGHAQKRNDAYRRFKFRRSHHGPRTHESRVQITTPAPLDQFLPPRLVRLMIDVENELLEFKRSVQKGQNLIQQFQLSASTFELEIAKNLQRLSAVMVEGVHQGVFNAPEISIGP